MSRPRPPADPAKDMVTLMMERAGRRPAATAADRIGGFSASSVDLAPSTTTQAAPTPPRMTPEGIARELRLSGAAARGFVSAARPVLSSPTLDGVDALIGLAIQLGARDDIARTAIRRVILGAAYRHPGALAALVSTAIAGASRAPGALLRSSGKRSGGVPQAVRDNARRGLEYRRKQGANKSGLTAQEAGRQGIGSGVVRATSLAGGGAVSLTVLRQMRDFFNRHAKNKTISPEHNGEPWKDRGHVAWLLWGGDAGRVWANQEISRLEGDGMEKAQKVIAIGKQGGKIVGYKPDGAPVYGKDEPDDAKAPVDDTQAADDGDEVQPEVKPAPAVDNEPLSEEGPPLDSDTVGDPSPTKDGDDNAAEYHKMHTEIQAAFEKLEAVETMLNAEMIPAYNQMKADLRAMAERVDKEQRQWGHGSRGNASTRTALDSLTGMVAAFVRFASTVGKRALEAADLRMKGDKATNKDGLTKAVASFLRAQRLHKSHGAPDATPWFLRRLAALDSALAPQLCESEIPGPIAVLMKGAAHKYIRRVPKPGGGYRYFYRTPGVTRDVAADLKQGAKFKLEHEGQAGHFEVIARDGDRIRLRHDETGGSMTVSAAALSDLLRREHADVVSARRDRLKRDIAQARKTGTKKQISRLEDEAKRHGFDELTADREAAQAEDRFFTAGGRFPGGVIDGLTADQQRQREDAARRSADKRRGTGLTDEQAHPAAGDAQEAPRQMTRAQIENAIAGQTHKDYKSGRGKSRSIMHRGGIHTLSELSADGLLAMYADKHSGERVSIKESTAPKRAATTQQGAEFPDAAGAKSIPSHQAASAMPGSFIFAEGAPFMSVDDKGRFRDKEGKIMARRRAAMQLISTRGLSVIEPQGASLASEPQSPTYKVQPVEGAEAPYAAALGVDIKPEQMPVSVGLDAYQHSSHTPTLRGEQVQADYLQQIESVAQRLAQAAKSDEAKAEAAQQLEAYRDGYAKRVKAWMAAKGRTSSWAITGRGGLTPARIRSNEKRMDTEHRRLDELLEWKKKAERRALSAVRDVDAPAPEPKPVDGRVPFFQHRDDANDVTIEDDALNRKQAQPNDGADRGNLTVAQPDDSRDLRRLRARLAGAIRDIKRPFDRAASASINKDGSRASRRAAAKASGDARDRVTAIRAMVEREVKFKDAAKANAGVPSGERRAAEARALRAVPSHMKHKVEKKHYISTNDPGVHRALDIVPGARDIVGLHELTDAELTRLAGVRFAKSARTNALRKALRQDTPRDAASVAHGALRELAPPPVPNRAPFPYVGTMRLPGGLVVNVENARGMMRRGVDNDGRPWSVQMPAHYGEIANTLGADGDPVDVFVGPDVEGSPNVYLVALRDPATNAYDEDKVFIGFPSKGDAIAAYRATYNRSDLALDCRGMAYPEFLAWLERHGHRGRRIDAGRLMSLRRSLGHTPPGAPAIQRLRDDLRRGMVRSVDRLRGDTRTDSPREAMINAATARAL